MKMTNLVHCEETYQHVWPEQPWREYQKTGQWPNEFVDLDLHARFFISDPASAPEKDSHIVLASEIYLVESSDFQWTLAGGVPDDPFDFSQTPASYLDPNRVKPVHHGYPYKEKMYHESIKISMKNKTFNSFYYDSSNHLIGFELID